MGKGGVLSVWARARKLRDLGLEHPRWLPLVLGVGAVIILAVAASGGSQWFIAMATAEYVALTAWLALESRETRRQDHRPVVTFSLGREADDALLIVENTGSRAAHNVQICLDRPIEVLLDDNQKHSLMEVIGFLAHPLPLLPPQRSVAARFVYQDLRDKPEGGTAVQRFVVSSEPDSPVISGIISYEDTGGGRRFSEPVAIDFRSFYNLNLSSTRRTESIDLGKFDCGSSD